MGRSGTFLSPGSARIRHFSRSRTNLDQIPCQCMDRKAGQTGLCGSQNRSHRFRAPARPGSPHWPRPILDQIPCQCPAGKALRHKALQIQNSKSMSRPGGFGIRFTKRPDTLSTFSQIPCQLLPDTLSTISRYPVNKRRQKPRDTGLSFSRTGETVITVSTRARFRRLRPRTPTRAQKGIEPPQQRLDAISSTCSWNERAGRALAVEFSLETVPARPKRTHRFRVQRPVPFTNFD